MRNDNIHNENIHCENIRDIFFYIKNDNISTH